uniref:Uncharacterized protein n=2 Tax=Lutzomyia longipalpis TaxID=7200 RepID=A0A1B0CAW6_LUTLO
MDFVEQTNIREIVDEYLQKHFSDTEISTLKDPYLKYFYKIYTENPTSRRCTEVNLHQLTFKPPQFSSVEKKLLDKYKIEDCTVAMGSANVLFSIEKRIYRRFRKKNPTTRTHIDFFQPKTFHAMTMEYLQHIHSNVERILRHPEIDRGKTIEDLVTLLFDRLDALTPCEELPLTPISIEDLESTLEEANVTEEIHLEDVSLAEELSPQKTPEVIPSTPISIEILDFEFKDPYHCTAKGVEEQLFHDGRLEIPIEIFTRNGPMDITLRHDDIGRFLDVKPRVWKGIKTILAGIENEDSATQQRKVLLAKFSNVFCDILSRAKGRNPGFTRYYIQHFDGNVTQNCIEVIHKM